MRHDPSKDPQEDAPELGAHESPAEIGAKRDSGIWKKGDHYEALNPVGDEDHYEELNPVPGETSLDVEGIAEAIETLKSNEILGDKPLNPADFEKNEDVKEAMADVLDMVQQRIMEDPARQDLAKMTDADIDRVVRGIGLMEMTDAEQNVPPFAEFVKGFVKDRIQELKEQENLGPDGKVAMSPAEFRKFVAERLAESSAAADQDKIARAKADLAAVTEGEIDSALENMSTPKMESSPAKDAVLMRTEIARLDATAKTVKNGPKS
jgi:hypothetical protein